MRPLSRREFLVTSGGAYAALVLGACAPGRNETTVVPSSGSVREAERKRRRAGATVHDVELTASKATADLAGLTAATWAYNGALPGPEIRVKAGDVIRARFTNELPEPTTVHWHGIALRNDM
ncbi:MAG: multicopper oxidase domain-containing protein, partial [Acidimicrobiales bacterium]